MIGLLAAMFILSSVSPLAQGKTTSDPLTFGNIDPEIDLVGRFLDSRHVLYIHTTSTFDSICIFGKANKAALISSYQRLFGVNLRLRGPRNEVVVPFARVSAEGGGMRIADVLKKVWARDSMLSRAVVKAASQGDVNYADRIVACTYLIRPWLSAKHRRTELLQGTLLLKRKGREVDVYLRYENGESTKH